MNKRHNSGSVRTEEELEAYEELGLAMAQSEIVKAMKAGNLTRAQLAENLGRPKSFISKILGGGHNLTVKTMARVLAACGFELRFQRTAPVERAAPTTAPSTDGLHPGPL
jgi:transcriptional regulator with XRE-family HTH domain